jgi:transposase
LSEVAKWVEDGPDPKTDGVVRWRCADLRDRIAAKFNIHLHERSVGKLLKKLDFSSMSVRPMPRRPTLRRRRLLKKLRQAGTRRDPAAACRPVG